MHINIGFLCIYWFISVIVAFWTHIDLIISNLIHRTNIITHFLMKPISPPNKYIFITSCVRFGLFTFRVGVGKFNSPAVVVTNILLDLSLSHKHNYQQFMPENNSVPEVFGTIMVSENMVYQSSVGQSGIHRTDLSIWLLTDLYTMADA